MDLYTFIMAFRGGTYISQVSADNVNSACFEWAKQLTVNDIKYFGPAAKRELINSWDEEFSPVPITGVINVWCYCVGLRVGFIMVNIIKTSV